MSVYRIKQFIWATKSLVEKVDTKYINKFLNKREKQLFNRLKKVDKHHSIRVCKEAINISKDKNIDINRVAKAALLHDIGKSEYSLNIIEKSILVLLHKGTKGKIKKFNNIKAIDIYYNHAAKGADILKRCNTYDKEFLDTIRYHHHNNIKESKLLQIIKESDDRS